MIKQLWFVFCIVFSFSSFTQEWKQDQTQTKVDFVIKNFGVNVDGNFNGIKISTNFNFNQLQESYINAEIAVESITTGMSSRDKHLLKKDYFDVENHKFIQLKSTSIKKDQKGNIILSGDLTIKGIVKQIKIPIKILESENMLEINANFIINRKDFDIGGGSFVLSKFVNIKVKFKGTK